MAVQQKGANGLIAEYCACETLTALLEVSPLKTISTSTDFRDERLEAEHRVGNELNPDQIQRARRQGQALGEFIFEKLTTHPPSIGLSFPTSEIASGTIEIHHVGSNTASGRPEDVEIVVELADGKRDRAPISLKAYKGGTVSLGSKSAKAALSRLFLDEEKCSDKEFGSKFGHDGAELLRVLALFKETAKRFYESDASTPFLDEYELRKGTRKVNNPLRRKEVGEFFSEQHGYVSEHYFADLFSRIFNDSFDQMKGDEVAEGSFIRQLRFVLGNPEVLALNAVAESLHSDVMIDSSFSNETYRKLNSILRLGMTMKLYQKSKSSIVRVEAARDNLVSSDLSLAVWKDATIQFKLHA